MERFKERGASLVAISVDPAETSRKLSEALALSFPLLSDPSLEVTKKFGVADEENGIAWPTVFIIRKDGRVAWRAISETYKKRPLAEELLSRLDAEAPRPPR